MRKKIIYLSLILSLLFNLTFLGLYNRVAFNHSKKIVNYLIDYPKLKKSMSDIQYYNGLDFNITGTFVNEKKISRLPIKYKEIVRPAVWNLSENSSGISIRFKTNSPSITVKWKLKRYKEYPNMSQICSSGLDLYCLVDNKWQYISSGVPKFINNEQFLISNWDTISKDFILDLPLYDGIENIEIGIKKGFQIAPGKDNFAIQKPIVFYGTSITQGASASRPGLAYPSIISRELNIETINLGFSGNGLFEKSVGLALCEINAGMYVIDCVANSSPDVIKSNTYELIKQINSCNPNVPILLVERIMRVYTNENDTTFFGGGETLKDKHFQLKQAYDKAKKDGINIYYLSSNSIGFDSEETIDGGHLNDLGMKRIAKKIGGEIKKILELEKTTGANNVYTK